MDRPRGPVTDPIPFNRPYLTGDELKWVQEAWAARKLSGDGPLTRRCSTYFEERYRVPRALLTTSCTDALEMAAILSRIQPGEEVIAPSYTFVSSVNPFLLRGAKVRFVDSRLDHPGMDEAAVEELITPRTKAIVVVHYAGVACEMDILMGVARKHGLKVIEDAAQCVEARYKGRQLGTIGDFGAFSFHETKNIQCGEGGLLLVNDPTEAVRAEIIREKGTNRTAFFRGEVDKYGWVDIGSSFLPPESVAAMLWAQLERLERIQVRRMMLWERYREGLARLDGEGLARMPEIPGYADHNAHLFYLVLRDLSQRTEFIEHMKRLGIMAVFHYQALHKSRFFENHRDGEVLPMADRYSDCLVRLPLFHELSEDEQDRIIKAALSYFGI